MTGKEVRKLRKRLDMNQHQLARIAKVSQTMVSMVENDLPVSETMFKAVVNALANAQRREKEIIAA